MATAIQLTDGIPQDEVDALEIGIMRRGEMVGQIETFKAAKVDARAAQGRLTAQGMMAGQHQDLPAIDRVRILAATPKGEMPLALTESAHQQVASKLDIPWPYYERMLEQDPDLAATNINRWLGHAKDDVRLVRMLKPITEQDHARAARMGTVATIRAFLGERYRTIDHADLLNVIMPEAEEAGLYVSEFKLTETHFFAKFTNIARGLDQLMGPQMLAELRATIGAANGIADYRGQHRAGVGLHGQPVQDIAWVNERIRLGFVIQNSETGHGSYQVSPFGLVVRCLNGIWVVESYGGRHVGRKRGETGGDWGLGTDGDDATYGADTRALEDAAVFLRVRDRVREAIAESTQQKIAAKIATEAGTPLAIPATMTEFEFIDTVGAKFQLGEDERAILQEEIKTDQLESPFGSQLTRWTLSQGLTATARRLGATKGYARQVELERAGWTVLNDAATELVRVADRKARGRKN